MVQCEVLIVEENRQVRELFQQIFLIAGYKCLLASDVEEGLKAFRDSHPSLVVTDLRMPMAKGDKSERDAGIRLLLEIRHEDPDVAVIVCTGGPEAKFLVESLKLGAHAFLAKPVNVDELLITAKRALEWRQLLIERRQYQDLLERRVVETTHDLEHAYRQLQDTYRTTLKALGSALGDAKAARYDSTAVAAFFKTAEALLAEGRRKSGES